MRIRVLSDLHLEFGRIEVSRVPADVVVLAGDVDRGARGVAWAKETFPEVPVLYVAGNHEHYEERLGRLHEKLRAAAAGSNVRIMENDTVEIGGYRFFGATLWTDFNLFGDRMSAMTAAGSKETGMNDYRKIRRKDTGPLRPQHTARTHADTRLALQQFLLSGDRARSVVISHHAPSLRSLPADRHGDPVSPAYASNLESLIFDCGPALWVHGHIHAASDYVIGKTRIVDNAKGYPEPEWNETSGFESDLIINLSERGAERARARDSHR